MYVIMVLLSRDLGIFKHCIKICDFGGGSNDGFVRFIESEAIHHKQPLANSGHFRAGPDCG